MSISIHCPFNDTQVEIDKSIADLIKQTWIANIETLGACQELRNNMIHIQFNSVNYEKFMSIITDFDNPMNDDEMFIYYKVESDDGIYTSFNLRNKNFHVIDNWESHDRDAHPLSKMEIICSLSFVSDFYHIILNKMIKYNTTLKD
jgi:hypothetical protein